MNNMQYILRKPCLILLNLNDKDRIVDIKNKTKITYAYIFKIRRVFIENKIVFIKKKRLYLTEKGKELKQRISELSELLK